MKKYLLVVFVAILSACSPAITSTPVQETATEEVAPTPAPVSTATPVQETAIAVVTDSSVIKFYPLDTKTGNADIDIVLSAVASGDTQELINLFDYTTTACKTVNALGGPPPCREGEAEGTKVEVLPFLGSEGSYLRKDEVSNFPGLNVTGVYAIYQVSETAYSEENFPKGEYGIMLTAPENRPGVVLQIKNGLIVRVDYVFDPQSFDTILQRDVSTFVLSPISK